MSLNDATANIKEVDLLGNTQLRWLSVVQVEGSCSYKAIAFINGNQRSTRLKAKSYSTLRKSLQQTQVFLKNKFSVRKPPLKNFNKQLSDEKWIK
jgi:hypothetical protein